MIGIVDKFMLLFTFINLFNEYWWLGLQEEGLQKIQFKM